AWSGCSSLAPEDSSPALLSYRAKGAAAGSASDIIRRRAGKIKRKVMETWSLWPDRPQAGVVGDGLPRFYPDIERDRLVPLRADLDPVRPGLEIQVLEHAVEVVDDAHVVTVGVDLGVRRRIDDANAAIRAPGQRGVVAGRRQRIAVARIPIPVRS